MSEPTETQSVRDVFAIVQDHVIFEQLGENIVLLDLHAQQYYELNSVASCIFVLIQEYSDLDQVLQVMLQEYQADEVTLRTELLKFVDRLTSQGWLRTHHRTPA